MIDESRATCVRLDSARLREEDQPMSARGLIPINEMRLDQVVITADDVAKVDSTCLTCQETLLEVERIVGGGATHCTVCLKEMQQNCVYVGDQENAPLLSDVVIEAPDVLVTPRLDPRVLVALGEDIADAGGVTPLTSPVLNR